MSGTHLGEDHLPGMYLACASSAQVNFWKSNAVPLLEAVFHNQGCEATHRMTALGSLELWSAFVCLGILSTTGLKAANEVSGVMP